VTADWAQAIDDWNSFRDEEVPVGRAAGDRIIVDWHVYVSSGFLDYK